ncbi:MAG: hypothetical protein RSB18_10195, partial [Clostridia bacterium]
GAGLEKLPEDAEIEVVFVHRTVHRLIHATVAETIKSLLNELSAYKLDLKRLNKLSASVGNCELL